MKKWSKLVLATMLSAGTLLVSGCIENIEPEGIADLRGAKAELLRAQTALQAAQAAKVEADAALVLAQAKVQEAIAKQEEAKVAFIEAQTLAEQYKAEYQKLVNEAYAQEQEDAHQLRMHELEALIAEQEAKMAEAEEVAAKAAEEFKIYMLDVARRLAEAQLQYDKAMDDLEVSRNTLTEKQQAYLWERLMAVDELKRYVASLTEELEDATDELADATAELDEPTAQRVAIKKAERAVAKFQAKYEAALEAEEVALALLELDPMVTDWDAKREEIEDQKKALEKERDAKAVEAADRAKVWRDSIDLLDAAAEQYSAATGYAFNKSTGLFSKVPGTYTGSRDYIDVPEVYVPAPLDDEGYPIFGFSDFTMIGNSYTYGDEENVIDQFEKKILALSTYNTDAYQEQIDNLNDLIEAAQADWNYKIPMTRYEDAVAAYKAGEYLPYFNKYVFTQSNGYAADFSLEELVADYNESLVDLNAAIEEFESVIEKYDVDLSEEMAALTATQNEENAAADLAKLKAYQDAKDKLVDAEVKYHKAMTAYLNAEADYNRKIAIYTQDASYADMKSYIEVYDQYVSAGGDPATANDPNYDTATYNKYKSNVASYDAAQKAFNDIDVTNENDAQSVWDKASDVYNKAYAEYNDALTKANKTHTDAYAAAQLKYDNAYRELNASKPQLDSDYSDYLSNAVTDARNAVGTAMVALVGELESNYREREVGEDATTVVAEGTTYEFQLTVCGVPSYLRKDVYDASANTVKYELIPADLKTIQDADYFLDEVITKVADNLVYVQEEYVVEAYESANWSWTLTYKDLYYVGEYADYPLVLPDYESFVGDYEVNFEPQKQRVLLEAYDELASWGYDIQGVAYTNSGAAGVLAQVYLMKMEIAELEAQMKNIALVPDFIKAIEAAKAEVEAYAAEKAAEINALKADVEANYPRLLEELEAVMEDADAFTEKVAALDETLTTLNMLIGNYCNGFTDLDDFVASLEAEYETALQTTWDVENKLINAEKALADLKEGLVTAVEAAQKTFDQVTEELAEAQALLDFAVEELEKAIELIYGDEELPEDPGTEDPGTEDPGTGDEGGEEETPAA